MAAERNIEIKVGLLVLVCVAILVTFVIVLGDFSGTHGAELFLDVDTSASLKPGAVVKIAGVNAGKVSAVEYRGGAVDAKTHKPVVVRVEMNVEPEMLATLKRDSRFYITTQGVLGEKYVEIDPGTADGPALAPGDVVDGEPPLRLELMAVNANRVLASLSEVLRKNQGALDSIIVDAAATMASIRQTADRIDAVVVLSAPKVGEVIDKLDDLEDGLQKTVAAVNNAVGDGTELKATLANVQAVSAEVRAELGPIAADARALMGQAQTTVADVRGALDGMVAKVGGILDDAKTLTQRLKDGQGTIGALLSDKEMYDDVREMMKDLKRHPWKFIWKE